MSDKQHRSRPVLVVRGGRVVDSTGERRADVLIENGYVALVASEIDPPHSAVVIDASSCVVAPGLVDLHTHLREPGAERAETIETGARAGALGGYTALVAMPNTEPPIDSASMVRAVLERAESALIEIVPTGTITLGRRGTTLAPIGEMAELGVQMFTDDGSGVQDPGLMRRALEYGRDLSVVLAQHCEDEALSKRAAMHEGTWSSRLGIPGQTGLSEEVMLARDLALVRETGATMHFLHLSTAGSIALFRAAKSEGLPVTAEATPHHIALSDAVVASFDPRFKVNPPLRSDSDCAAVRKGIRDATIDAIATDHAPHTTETKEVPFEEAAFGMLGLETSLAVAYTELVANPKEAEPPLSMTELFGLFSWRPAKIAGLHGSKGHGGPIEKGAHANLVVFDPHATWTVDADALSSRSTNTPFDGFELTGRVRHTISCGELVVEHGKALR